ncbi:hypothetical protein C8Q76DRAFT_689816 [Earliella scabrosa]|nr:hypothetical protein C8Q76DRAFT_689816 [Earliella scabrosa]
MPALYSVPVIVHNDSGIICKTLICGGQEVSDHGRDVHLLMLEYGPGLHALLVCAVTSGGVCDDPPVVLRKTLFPHKHVQFTLAHVCTNLCSDATYTVTIAQEDNQYSLEFHRPAQFWQIVRNISQAQRACDDHDQQVERFLEDALREVCAIAARDRALASSLD